MEPLIQKLSEAQHVNLSDQAAADAINAMTVQVKQLAPALKIKEWSFDEQLYSAIIDGCSSSDTAIRKLCINIRGWIDDPRVQNVDLDKTSAIATMNALISTGMASSDQVDRLKALKWKTIKWTESVGLPVATPGAVRTAREYMGAV
jgi:hypothetical protein